MRGRQLHADHAASAPRYNQRLLDICTPSRLTVQRADKRRRRVQRLALAADDEEVAADYGVEAKQAAKDIRTLEVEREMLTTLHTSRASRTHIFADLIACKNDATARLSQMTIEVLKAFLGCMAIF